MNVFRKHIDNQFLVVAAAKKMSALLTQDDLELEAKQGAREDFERMLKAVSDVLPNRA